MSNLGPRPIGRTSPAGPCVSSVQLTRIWIGFALNKAKTIKATLAMQRTCFLAMGRRLMDLGFFNSDQRGRDLVGLAEEMLPENGGIDGSDDTVHGPC